MLGYNRAMAPDELVRKNLGLAYKIGRRFALTDMGIRFGTDDDCVQEAVLGLIRAADYFDPFRGAKFSTYACRVMWERLSMAARRYGLIRMPRRSLVSEPKHNEAAGRALSLSLDHDETAVDDAHDASPTPLDQAAKNDLVENLLAAVAKLDARTRQVLALRYSDGLGYQAIGKAIGNTKQRAHQIVLEGIAKLRTLLAR